MSFLRSYSFSKGLKLSFLPFIFLLVQSCGQSEIGQQLAESFDAPLDPTPKKELEEKRERLSVNSKSFNKKKKVQKVIASSKNKEVLLQISKDQKRTRPEEKVIPFTPQPYRITIKLSAANPSAPAETVTKALRKAGIRFEVERIELVESPSDSAKKMNIPRNRR